MRWSTKQYQEYMDGKKEKTKISKPRQTNQLQVSWSTNNDEVTIVIKGRPITKKNHQQVITNPKTGQLMVVQSQAYQNYEEQCLWLLAGYDGLRFDGKVHVTCRYWMPNRRGWPDLIGLMQATWDILEKTGVIRNDRDIVNSDGSRIEGIDKENPRAEITIRYEEGAK